MKKLTLLFAGLLLTVLIFGQTKTIKNDADLVISASNLNMLYRGIDNPIEICASGFEGQDLIVEINEGAELIEKDKHYFLKILDADTRVIKMEVSINTEQGLKNIGSQSFRVLNLPAPEVRLNGVLAEGNIYKQDLMNGKLIATYGNMFFPFNVAFEVVSFNFSYKINNQTISYRNTGNELNIETKNALKKLESGTQIVFESIKVKGPSGIYDIMPIFFILK